MLSPPGFEKESAPACLKLFLSGPRVFRLFAVGGAPTTGWLMGDRRGELPIGYKPPDRLLLSESAVRH